MNLKIFFKLYTHKNNTFLTINIVFIKLIFENRIQYMLNNIKINGISIN